MMNRILLFVILTFAASSLFNACDDYTQDGYIKDYVVEAYLQTTESLPPIYLSTTQPLEAFYSFENASVRDAQIQVELLDEAGIVEEAFQYVHDSNSPGVYLPVDVTHQVLPLRSYRLNAVIPSDENHQISAVTLTPDVFEIVDINQDSVVYQSSEQLEIRVTNREYPGRQNYFIVTLVSQDTTNDLTPFYANQVEDNDDVFRSDFELNSSGIIAEGNFEVNPDNTVDLQLPWLAVAFYGQHTIETSVIDDSIFDFVRSQDVQFGGSTVSPREIYDVIDSIDGGTGIFGSYAQVTTPIYIKKNPLFGD